MVGGEDETSLEGRQFSGNRHGTQTQHSDAGQSQPAKGGRNEHGQPPFCDDATTMVAKRQAILPLGTKKPRETARK